MKRLLIKISDFVSECNELYGIKIGYRNIIKLKDIKKLRKKLYKIKKSENITFVHRRSKRKTAIQNSIETLEEYCNKNLKNIQIKYIYVVIVIVILKQIKILLL